MLGFFFFFSSRRRHTRFDCDWSSDVCSSDLLEVGVGTGRYAVPLQKSGIRLVGVDISRKMVEFGLAKGLRDVVFADAARLPFVSGSFDVATTNHVLHLIPDWRDGLRGIARVTRG